MDIRHINNLGLSKFRTGDENGKEQVSYFNSNKKVRFLAVRKQTSTGKVIFSMVSLIDKSNKFENNY